MGLLTHSDFEREMKSGSYRPVYAFLGPESFLRRQELMVLKRNVLTPESIAFNYSEFSLRTTSVGEVLKSTQTYPFGSSRRLVVASDIEALQAEGQDELVEYLERPFEKAVLVLDGGELDRRTIFYKALREKASIIEFPYLKGIALEKWAGQFIRGKGLRIATSALEKLVGLAGSDLQSLAAEIEKLEIYCGAEKTIPESAVEVLVQASRQHGIFELTGAIGRKDHRKALQLLANLLESGEAALGIVAMIARHFRQLLIAKELLTAGKPQSEIAVAAQIPPFVLDDFLRQARAFDWETARKIYVRIAGVDSRIKSSKLDPRTILEELICSI